MGSMFDLSPKELRALELAARRAGVKPVTILKAARGKRLVTLDEYEAKRGLGRQAHAQRRKAA